MNRIELRYGYRGWKSNEQWIPPGIYDDHDPKVIKIVSYLINNGHAEYIQDDIVPENSNTVKPSEPIEFTAQALSLINEHDLDHNAIKAFFPDHDKIGIQDVRDYIATLE